MKLGLLASGNLGYIILEFLFIKHRVQFVMTDKKSLQIIDFCKINKINYFVGNPRNENAAKFYLNEKVDVLISCNYLFLITNDLIQLPAKISFNIHGSLLPKYRGRTPHVWAIINNETQAGITAHLIDEGCDTGPIIEQEIVEIDYYDTGNDLLIKYNSLYVELVDRVLKKVRENTLSFRTQNNDVSTYFNKRSPEDGLINWDWQKERIRNWVRALSSPYPGAFTFYNNEKVFVDEIEFAENGFHQDMSNGTIVDNKLLLVKTANGVVLLKRIRTNVTFFEKFKIFTSYENR